MVGELAPYEISELWPSYPPKHPLGDETTGELAQAIRDMARATEADSKYSSHLLLPGGFFECEVIERVQVGGGISLKTMPNELVFVDFNMAHLIPGACDLRLALKAAITPFIEGIGKIECRDTAKGFIVLLSNGGQEDGVHPVVPPVALLRIR